MYVNIRCIRAKKNIKKVVHSTVSEMARVNIWSHKYFSFDGLYIGKTAIYARHRHIRKEDLAASC